MKIGTFSNIKNRVCKYCNLNFTNIAGFEFANHVRWCEKNPNLNIEKEKYRSKLMALKSNTKLYGKKEYHIVQCTKCLKFFVVEMRYISFLKKRKFYCSMSCRNTRPHTESDKLKIKNCICKNGKTLSQNTKELWKDDNFSKKVLKNNAYFTSKGERYLRNYFITTYVDEKWTFGGQLSYDGVDGIVRDLYSPLLKICIEYDGIWHFEDIKGQLKSKQKKDKALEKWCIDSGYRLIRIEDGLFQSDSLMWIKKIRDAIDNDKRQIIKFYP